MKKEHLETLRELRPQPPFKADIEAHVRRISGLLARHRERYVRAWIAATGLTPQDAMLTERQWPDGRVTVTVDRRDSVPAVVEWKDTGMMAHVADVGPMRLWAHPDGRWAVNSVAAEGRAHDLASAQTACIAAARELAREMLRRLGGV